MRSDTTTFVAGAQETPYRPPAHQTPREAAQCRPERTNSSTSPRPCHRVIEEDDDMESLLKRFISRADLWKIPQASLGFLLRATSDNLLCLGNLHQWEGGELLRLKTLDGLRQVRCGGHQPARPTDPPSFLWQGTGALRLTSANSCSSPLRSPPHHSGQTLCDIELTIP